MNNLDWITALGAVTPPDQAQINNAVLANGIPASLAAPGAPQSQPMPMPAPAQMPSPVKAMVQKPKAKASPQMSQAFRAYLPAPQGQGDPQSDGYAALSKQAIADQQKQLDGLNQYINDIAAKPQGIDFSALAAYVDGTTGSKLYQAAKDTAPMSAEEKDKMLFGLKNQLAMGQAKLSQESLDGLKAQTAQAMALRKQDFDEEYKKGMLAKVSHGSSAQEIRAQTMMGNQALQQVSKIHDDSAIKQMRAQAANVDKGLDLMSVPNVSNKALSEVAQDISAALTGKAASSDFKLRELMTPTLRQKLSDSVAFLTSKPDQPAPPEVVKFWRNMGERLQESYDGQLSARAQGKLEGIKTAAKFNPIAYSAAKEAADLYKDGKWRILEGREKPGTIIPAPHGDTVTQDGHTFRWNGSKYVVSDGN